MRRELTAASLRDNAAGLGTNVSREDVGTTRQGGPG
jgi:hypothetical protein